MAKLLINNRQVKLIQRTTDNVRESLGREVQVYVGSGILAPGETWDPVNQEYVDPMADLVYDDTIYTIDKATVRWVDKGGVYEFLPGGRVRPGDVLVKCKLEDVLMSGTDVNNDTVFHHARKVIVDGVVCKVAIPPIKGGLRDLYNVLVWLKRVDQE
jgi:hypothetical protein